MITYMGYLIFGSMAVIYADTAWITLVWFGLVTIDWTTSIFRWFMG